MATKSKATPPTLAPLVKVSKVSKYNTLSLEIFAPKKDSVEILLNGAKLDLENAAQFLVERISKKIDDSHATVFADSGKKPEAALAHLKKIKDSGMINSGAGRKTPEYRQILAELVRMKKLPEAKVKKFQLNSDLSLKDMKAIDLSCKKFVFALSVTYSEIYNEAAKNLGLQEVILEDLGVIT